jgi:phosphoribosylamine--glycine ligase
VLHAGTESSSAGIVTNGGRVLNVVARGTTIEEARKRAYEAASKISFRGAHYRRDIGARNA